MPGLDSHSNFHKKNKLFRTLLFKSTAIFTDLEKYWMIGKHCSGREVHMSSIYPECHVKLVSRHQGHFSDTEHQAGRTELKFVLLADASIFISAIPMYSQSRITRAKNMRFYLRQIWRGDKGEYQKGK